VLIAALSADASVNENGGASRACAELAELFEDGAVDVDELVPNGGERAEQERQGSILVFELTFEMAEVGHRGSDLVCAV